MTYSIGDIAQIIGADSASLRQASVEHLLTDSRSLAYPDTTLFFAIQSATNNGARYIPGLYAAGVRNFVVAKSEPLPQQCDEANFLRVDSPIDALHRLAAWHRAKFDIPVIGITGSHGKTTLKEWLNMLLHDRWRVARSPRSYNSQIGVPLSLWEIDEGSQLAIVEAGISRHGEMQALQAMIRPEIGVITCIDNEHDDGFDSMQQKCDDKCALFGAECKTIVYCADQHNVADAIGRCGLASRGFAWSTDARSGAALIVESTEVSADHRTVEYRTASHHGTITIPFAGEVEFSNAMHCVAVMLALGCAEDEIGRCIASLTWVGTRIDVIEGCNNCLVVTDEYPSDYNSLAPAIDFMARRSTGNRRATLILSDLMHESYDEAELYQKVARLVAQRRISRFIGIGPEMLRHSALFAADAEFYASTDAFLEARSVSDFANEQILIKGSPKFGFSRIADMLEARMNETVLKVNLDAVASNFNFYRSHLRPDTLVVCMLKASGYGAGSYELAKTVQDRGAGYIAVAVTDEGADLRKAGITMPIMVLNPKVVDYHTLFANRLEPEIYSIDMAREIIREARKYGVSDYPVHIKIDTGMHRLGFLKEQLPQLVELLQSQSAIRPASVFSHLAVADMPSEAMDSYTRQQFAYFDECSALLQQGFKHHILRHILNTAGILRFPDHQFDMVRLGIGLYGIKILNDGSEDGLRPVSSLNTMVISIKEWPSGTTIGYGRRGVLSRPSRIATIPIGYADGLNRHLSNGVGQVFVGGRRCPIVGNICMDQCMVDVTDTDCQVGDRVEIFGEHIPVSEIADALGTIPYEVLTSVSTRVKRVYYRE